MPTLMVLKNSCKSYFLSNKYLINLITHKDIISIFKYANINPSHILYTNMIIVSI